MLLLCYFIVEHENIRTERNSNFFAGIKTKIIKDTHHENFI